MQIERHHAGHVRAIECAEDPFAARQRRDFFHRLYDAGNSAYVAGEDDSRARCNRVVDAIQNFRRRLRRHRNLILLHHDAVSLGSQQPWLFASGMLLVAHQNFVSGFHIKSVGDVVVRFGGVANNGDFVACSSHKSGQRIAIYQLTRPGAAATFDGRRDF